MNLLTRLRKAKAEDVSVKDAVFTMRMDDTVLTSLERLAEKIGKSRSWVVTQLILAAVEEFDAKS